MVVALKHKSLMSYMKINYCLISGGCRLGEETERDV